MTGLMGAISQSNQDQAENAAETPAENKPELRQIGDFTCVVVKETISFRATKAENRQQGLEYDEVKNEKDPTAEVLYRRKPETVELAYPLLSNLGIAADFDLDKMAYADKNLNFVFGLLQQAVYAEAKAFIDDGKSFTLADISLAEIASKEPAKRGGRRGEIDQTLLESSIAKFAEWLAGLGRSKQVVGLHVQVFKTRLRGTANWQPAILAKMGENLETWFASLPVGEEQDSHKDAYEFLSGKLSSVLEAQPSLDDM